MSMRIKDKKQSRKNIMNLQSFYYYCHNRKEYANLLNYKNI